MANIMVAWDSSHPWLYRQLKTITLASYILRKAYQTRIWPVIYLSKCNVSQIGSTMQA